MPVVYLMNLRSWAPGVVTALVLLALWEAAARVGLLNPFVLPAPAAVLTAWWELAQSGQLLSDVAESLRRVGFGFLLSVALATPLGFALGLSPAARASLNPLLQFLKPIPPIAWIPLSILWFGLGEGPAYSLTMIASFFPILLNTLSGVERVDPLHIDVAKSFGASRWQMLTEVYAPSALASILTGYRVGLGIAWMAVMAAEMVATHSGVGYLIQVSQNLLRTDRVLAGMVTIGLVGLALDTLLGLARRKLVRA